MDEDVERLFEVEPVGEQERVEREATAQTLLAFYIDRVRELEVEPPRTFVGALAAQIRQLVVEEGQSPEAVELGLLLLAEQGERPSDLPFVLVKAQRRRARAVVSAFVTEYGWPTGCALRRGSHGVQEVYDVLGTDRPPSGWPHARPGRDEVEPILAALDSIGKFVRG